MTIDRSQWRWYGNAAHLIVGQDCRFHLATVIGPWIVSTVGQYLPDESAREIIAKSHGVSLTGKGDERRWSFMSQIGYETIGLGRTFETMVFRAGPPCTAEECGCGMPSLANASELDFAGYNDAKAAT